jgi:polyvinyl alcohol dehydrogenase (cytochrome)
MRRTRTSFALAAALALVATGASARPGAHAKPCRERRLPGGEWRGYGQDPAQSRSQPAETAIGAAAAKTLAPAWTFDVASAGDTGQLNSTPVVAGGCVFAASSTGVVYALDAADGTLVWRHAVPVRTAGLGGAIVSAAIAVGSTVVLVVNESGDGTTGPYLLALDAATGGVAWQSRPMSTDAGYYSNASPAEWGGVVVAGFSPPEGQQTGQGGFVVVDAATGETLATTTTVPPADQARGYAGGGLWSTAAFDTATGFAYLGGGNPFSHTLEHPNTNAVLKVDARRDSATFGRIVGAYKGNVDQYTDTLETLRTTPACEATSPVDFPLDDPACGQLDLDFGATPNVFTVGGRTVVGDLQKSGVYHVADAATMTPVWETIVGASCAVCNAASTAAANGAVYGTGTPGGVQFALAADGSRTWSSPVADGAHYEATSVANGVVYTVDTTGSFLAWDAASGAVLVHRPFAQDTGLPTGNLTSQGVAIAYHTVFAAANATTTAGADDGFLIAYRPAG